MEDFLEQGEVHWDKIVLLSNGIPLFSLVPHFAVFHTIMACRQNRYTFQEDSTVQELIHHAELINEVTIRLLVIPLAHLPRISSMTAFRRSRSQKDLSARAKPALPFPNHQKEEKQRVFWSYQILVLSILDPLFF